MAALRMTVSEKGRCMLVAGWLLPVPACVGSPGVCRSLGVPSDSCVSPEVAYCRNVEGADSVVLVRRANIGPLLVAARIVAAVTGACCSDTVDAAS